MHEVSRLRSLAIDGPDCILVLDCSAGQASPGEVSVNRPARFPFAFLIPLLLASGPPLPGPVVAPAPTAGAPAVAGTIRGDVDGNGTITAVDALAILSHVVGKPLPDGWSVTPQGDGNCNALITSFDALLVLSYVVGRDVSAYCVGRSLVASVDVTPDSSFVFVFDTLRLQAVARDDAGATVTGLTVAWTSSDTTVATVDGAGLVRAVGTGTTWVRGAVDDVADSAQVHAALLRTATQTVRIELPAGVPTTGLKVLTGKDSVPVTDLQATPVNLDPRLISTVGVLDAADHPILLGSALYLPEGGVLTINALSTAVSLVLMHPFVAPVLYFDPTGDQGYAATIAGLNATQALADLVGQKLPGSPSILAGMDAAVQTAVNDAAMAFLNSLPSLPSKSGPAGAVTLGPDTAQSGITVSETAFDSAGVRYLRLDVTNQRRRYLAVFVEDSAGSGFGVPSRAFVAPANDLIAFEPLAVSKQHTLVDLGSFQDAPAAGDITIKVYGPGIGSLPAPSEWARVAPPLLATTLGQFAAPLVAEILGVPSACAISIMNGVFSSTLADNALLTSLEARFKNEEYAWAVVEVVATVVSKVADQQVLLNFLFQCGLSTNMAVAMAGRLGAYAIPVLGQVRIAASVLSVAAVAVPTLYDVGRSTPRSDWALGNHLSGRLAWVGLDSTDPTATVEFVCKDVDPIGVVDSVRVDCARVIWDFGDGAVDTTTADSVTHAYADEGSYLVTARAVDENAATAGDTLRIEVSRARPGLLALLVQDLDAPGAVKVLAWDLEADTGRVVVDDLLAAAQALIPAMGNQVVGDIVITPDGRFAVVSFPLGGTVLSVGLFRIALASGKISVINKEWVGGSVEFGLDPSGHAVTTWTQTVDIYSGRVTPWWLDRPAPPVCLEGSVPPIVRRVDGLVLTPGYNPSSASQWEARFCVTDGVAVRSLGPLRFTGGVLGGQYWYSFEVRGGAAFHATYQLGPHLYDADGNYKGSFDFSFVPDVAYHWDQNLVLYYNDDKAWEGKLWSYSFDTGVTREHPLGRWRAFRIGAPSQPYYP